MLVLSRQRDETIMIGDDVEVTIVDIRGDKVRLGITAPKEITVHRKEVYEAIKRENRAAAQVRPEDLTTSTHTRTTGPRLASGASADPAKFDPDKPVVRPTIRATMPQAIRPQKPERSGPRPANQQHPPLAQPPQASHPQPDHPQPQVPATDPSSPEQAPTAPGAGESDGAGAGETPGT
jgi:carbon storage regulator